MAMSLDTDTTDDGAEKTESDAPQSEDRPLQTDPEAQDAQPEVDFDAFLAEQTESLDTRNEILALIENRRKAIAQQKVLEAEKAQDLRAGKSKFVNPVERISTPGKWSDEDIKKLVEAGVFNSEEDANTFKERLKGFNALIRKIRANMRKPIGRLNKLQIVSTGVAGSLEKPWKQNLDL
jgi:hypothetical protein